MRYRSVRRVALVCAIALCMLMPALVEARPGGGGHASSGRSSSSSSRSGSSYSRSGGYSGGGGGSFIAGNIDDVVFFVIIGIGVVWWIISALSGSDGGSGNAPAESLPPLNTGAGKQSGSYLAYRLGEIRRGDPLFNEDRFIDHAQTVFALLQKARNDDDLAPVLPFLDPSEADSLKAEMDHARVAGRRRMVEDAVVSGAEIYRVEKRPPNDAITVRIDASARDYYGDRATGARIAGSERPSPYTEYWTFERPQDAKTGGASEAPGSCPSCGAPLTLGSLSVCQACGNPLPARKDDWLVTAIVQSLRPDAAPPHGDGENGGSGHRDYLAAAASGDAHPIMRDLE